MRVEHRNRLAEESSPYLLQHAHNPVDWRPWGPEAFAQARSEDKPVFLSIGYSACHWCHVMERESFEDEGVARLLNESFIPVKVDREERPDVDQLYMGALQALGQAGGWPLSVWLTPSLKPFMGGTYFPKEGFSALLRQIAQLWKDQRAVLVDDAAQVARFLAERAAPAPPGSLDYENVSERAYKQLAQDYDRRHGGFMDAPKFPQAAVLQYLLRRHRRTGEPEALAMVEHTLRAMARGGLCDQLGGGFHRYATDTGWLVPHFEKMLYDNAQLATAYLEAFQVTGQPLYARVVRQTLDYVLRELRTPEGAFCCSEDADSEGEEGRYYLWSAEQVRAVLGQKDGERFCRAFAVRGGPSVLHQAEEGDFSRWRSMLLGARGRRVRPGRDDKVLTSWNALMVSALAKAAQVFPESGYGQAAAAAMRYLLDRHLRAGQVLRCSRQGRAGPAGLLEDYAHLTAALLDLYETTFAAEYYERADALLRRTLERFWDSRAGGFFASGADTDLIVRLREDYEGPLPLASSAMALSLLRLHELSGQADLRELAERTLDCFRGALGRMPSGYGSLLCALDFLRGPVTAVVVAGPEPEPLLRVVRGMFLPAKVVALADGQAAIPILEGRSAVGGKAEAFVCRDWTCLPPVSSQAELEAQLKESPH